MSRRDGVWVVMKGLGIYSLIQALLVVPYIVYWAVTWEPSAASVLPFGQMILYLAVGLYLLKGSKALLRWIGASDNNVAQPTATEPEQQ